MRVEPIFISYSSDDTEVVAQIADAFDELGIQFFLDQKDIHWGESVLRRLREGLSDCAAILAVMSPASIDSQWVPFEIGHALSSGKIVLPFLTDPDISIPAFLSGLHHITSLDALKSYFADPSSQLQPRTDHSSFGPFSGNYLAITANLRRTSLLVERAVCIQQHDQLQGTINGMCFLRFDPGKDAYHEHSKNTARYRFHGFVEERLAVLSYRAAKRGHHSAGAIALRADSTGQVLSGTWTGMVGATLTSAPCRWVKLCDSLNTELSESDLIKQALTLAPAFSDNVLLPLQAKSTEWVDIPLLRSGHLAKVSVVLEAEELPIHIKDCTIDEPAHVFYSSSFVPLEGKLRTPESSQFGTAADSAIQGTTKTTDKLSSKRRRMHLLNATMIKRKTPARGRKKGKRG